MLKSSLCDYSDSYIIVNNAIKLPEDQMMQLMQIKEQMKEKE